MAKLAIKKASTDVTLYVFIQASNVTTGAGLTGLVYNTENLVASYVRPLAARQALSLATLAAVDSAHSDGGFKEIDATNMPGVYRLDLPDAVCATGVNSAVVMLKGAANMAPLLLEIQLTDFDLNDASPNVTVVDIANDAITAASIATGAIDVDVSGVAAAVWGYATRTLTSFGALISSIWTYGTRTLTSFGTMSGTTTTEINVIGPVRNDGKIDAIAGDDYYAADGRGMAWSDTAWPDLTGASVSFISGSTTIAMTVVTPGTSEQVVSLDVPRATSLAMKGEFKFVIRATLSSTHVVTLLEGEGTFK